MCKWDVCGVCVCVCALACVFRGGSRQSQLARGSRLSSEAGSGLDGGAATETLRR